jgi:type II secretory pathway pseudopilin PulG
MNAADLIEIMLVAIVSAIAAVLLTVWVSSLMRAHRIRIEPTLGEARRAIIASLSGGGQEPGEVFPKLGRFSEHYIVSVMLDLAPSVTGTSRSALVALGESIGVTERALRGVRSRRWSTRLYAARVLTAFGTESPAMHDLLTDRSPDVRAQAAAWCAVFPTPEGIDELIRLLGDADGQCRFAAQDSLIRIGTPASEALITTLGTAGDQVTGRILEIAAATGDPRFGGPTRALLADPLHANRALAADVLASTGGASAGPTLQGLLDDPSDAVVKSAAKGIGKLAFRSGAAAVEPLLSHPTWKVRKQAGMTLLALGAPGAILLQANSPGFGPAADMATHALQLQALSIQEEAR